MIKYSKDYVKEVNERFPIFSEKEILSIINFGFRMYHYFNKIGADTITKDPWYNKFTIYTGLLGNNSLRHYNYSKFKWRIKIRTLFRLKCLDWDEYYYFGLTENEFKEFKDQVNNRKNKWIKFKYVYLYKLLDEVKVDISRKHIIKIKYPDVGYKAFTRNFKIGRDFEYILKYVDKQWIPINSDQVCIKKQQIHSLKD